MSDGVTSGWWTLENWLWCCVRGDLMLHAVRRAEVVDGVKRDYWVWAVHSVTQTAPPETGFAADQEEAQRFAEYSADGIEARRRARS